MCKDDAGVCSLATKHHVLGDAPVRCEFVYLLGWCLPSPKKHRGTSQSFLFFLNQSSCLGQSQISRVDLKPLKTRVHLLLRLLVSCGGEGLRPSA